MCQGVPVEAEGIERAIKDSLDLDAVGWHVVAAQDDRDEWAICLDHPASHGLVIETSTSTATDALRLALSILSSSDELAIVGAAPVLEHTDLLLGVRTLTQCHEWDNLEVRAVAFLMFEHGHITRAETAWLAGFIGRDAPRNPVDPMGVD